MKIERLLGLMVIIDRLNLITFSGVIVNSNPIRLLTSSFTHGLLSHNRRVRHKIRAEKDVGEVVDLRQ